MRNAFKAYLMVFFDNGTVLEADSLIDRLNRAEDASAALAADREHKRQLQMRLRRVGR